MQAVRKQAMDPATKARVATVAMSPLRPGAMVLRAAIWMPMEAGLENPQRAYVAITLQAK